MWSPKDKWDLIGCIMLAMSIVIPYFVLKLYAKYGIAMNGTDEGSVDMKIAYTILCTVTLVSSIVVSIIGLIIVINNL